jgi:hypothetical protein
MSTNGYQKRRFLEITFEVKRTCEDYGPISAPTYSLFVNNMELAVTVERGRWMRPFGGYWRTPWFLVFVGASGEFYEVETSGDFPEGGRH